MAVMRLSVAVIVMTLAGCAHRSTPNTPASLPPRSTATTRAAPQSVAPQSPMPVSPQDGAVLAADADPAMVRLSWRPASPPRGSRFFVEVVAADGAPFRGYVDGGQTTVPLHPGAYHWRVYAVSRAARRYAPGSWTGFTLQRPPPGQGAGR